MNNDLRHYLLRHSASTRFRSFTDDESLLEAGVIDSTTMVDLITHIESTYGIVVDEDEMIPENFDSINAIVAFVESKSVISS